MEKHGGGNGGFHETEMIVVVLSLIMIVVLMLLFCLAPASSSPSRPRIRSRDRYFPYSEPPAFPGVLPHDAGGFCQMRSFLRMRAGFPRIEYGAGLSEPAPDLIRGPE